MNATDVDLPAVAVQGSGPALEDASVGVATFVLDYDREVAQLVLDGRVDPGMVPRAVKECSPA